MTMDRQGQGEGEGHLTMSKAYYYIPNINDNILLDTFTLKPIN